VRIKIFFSLVCAIILYAIPCYGIGKQEQTNNAQTSVLTFTGVSGRLSSREESIQAALRDAARRLSFFYSVAVYSVKQEQNGGGAFDLNINSDYRLLYDDELEKYLEQIVFDPATDIFENNNAVFVIVRTGSDVSMPFYRGHSVRNERPRWIDTPPAEIGSFIAGTGFSSRLSSHGDTVIKSYEKAVIGIIENMNIRISGKQQSHYNNSNVFDFYLDSLNEIIAIGELRNFYIIESWTDPSNLSVWTLAVAKRR